MKKFMKPEVEIIRIQMADILTTSEPVNNGPVNNGDDETNFPTIGT